jgi:hypothetical protein
MLSIEHTVCICVYIYIYIYIYELCNYEYIIYVHMKVINFFVSFLCLSMFVAATRILSSARNSGL